jgi:phosphoglycerate mutase (EC 5.4.2.1)
MYGFEKGAVISAVDLIRGIGVYAGLEVLTVEGATGLYDTNYEGKAEAALQALKTTTLSTCMWRQATKLDTKGM